GNTITDLVNNVVEPVDRKTTIAMNSADGKSTVFHGTADPNTLNLNAKENDTYFRTNGSEKEMWRFTGTLWELILDTSETALNKEAIEQAQKEIEEAKKEVEEVYKHADERADQIVSDMDDRFDNLGFDKSFKDRLEELNKIAQDAINKSEVVGEIVGNDGRTLYNRNRLLGDTTRVISYEEGEIQLRHNGEGFMDNAPYVLSMKAAELLFPQNDYTADIKANAYIDTITEYITIGRDIK